MFFFSQTKHQSYISQALCRPERVIILRYFEYCNFWEAILYANRAMMLYPLQLFWDYDMIRLICGKWTKIVKLSKKKGRHDNVLILASDSTGKSLSEALISASTNLQYDDRLFIELQVQYMKIPSSEHGENMLCTEIVLNVKNNFCTHHVLPMFWAWNFHVLNL